jgi:hypothetical protein
VDRKPASKPPLARRPLAAIGRLDGTTVDCTRTIFDLGSGCMRGAPGSRVRNYPVRVQYGIEVDLAPTA